jgi:hypothetical protein
VLRVINGHAHDFVVGLPTDEFGPGAQYRISAMGLAFLNKTTLVVGGGGLLHGEDVLSAFQVPAENGPPLPLDAATPIGPLPAENDPTGAGNFHGICSIRGHLFATSVGNAEQAKVVRTPIHSSKAFGQLARFGDPPTLAGASTPVAITASARDELVVGLVGELGSVRDSQLAFCDAVEGKPLLRLKTGLYDIVGLAYGHKKLSANRTHLYAVDFAWSTPAEGGLFRLDAQRLPDGTQDVRATRLVSLDKPTSLAFAEDGSLYITVLGTVPAGSQEKTGQLLRFASGL